MKKQLFAIMQASALVLSVMSVSLPALAEEAEEISWEEVDGDSYLGKSTDFSYMIANGITTTAFDNYADAPCLQYALAKEWDPDGNGNARKLTLDILTPPGGAESDYANTLVSTGEYPDVMNIVMTSMTAAEMYEDGMTLDITDYVMQYMPNYRAFFERHPQFVGRETIEVDGEKRYLCLYHLDEVTPQNWGGMLYRRDWIVKYGTNPETGEAFSGEWQGENWVDDVVFPSGETYPKYISDWEWMLGIFQTALDDLGLEDGYAYCLASGGENGVYGDMESGFGGTGYYYIDPETGKCVYGAVSDGFRTYLECMHEWYEKGWINPAFEEHAGEMFFMVDMASVYSGKVGAWYGLTSQVGSTMDNSGGDESNPLNGIVVFPAPTAINDVYGDESVQNITPFIYYSTDQFGAQLVITEAAEDKDLPALFTFLDYFYGEEGSILLTYGLSGDQVKECEEIAPGAAEIYKNWGLENGSYTITDEGKYLKDPIVLGDDDISGASALVRFNGLTQEKDLDPGFPAYKEKEMALLNMYDTSAASIGAAITAQLTVEENTEQADRYNNTSTYASQVLPQFINGELDIYDDAAWEDYCDTLLNSYDALGYCDAINRVLGVED